MPLWTFTANRPRAGKDYLNGVAQTLYYGYAFEDSPLECSEETQKRITAALARDGGQCTLLTNKARILTIKH